MGSFIEEIDVLISKQRFWRRGHISDWPRKPFLNVLFMTVVLWGRHAG